MHELIPPNTVISNYAFLEVIGEGAFSHVYRAIHLPTKLPVAIKVIEKCDFPADKFERELQILKGIVHPFCVSFYEYIETEKTYMLVMEFIQGQNLLDYLNNRDVLPEFVVRHFFCQIVSAVDYLHNVARFIHRDLKVENVMIDRFNNIRLIDFGLGNSIAEGSQMFTTACGSAGYASPELLRGEPYTTKADIWSLGIILFALSTGMLPFEDNNIKRLVNRIVLTQPVYPDELDPELVDLMRHMMNKDPDTRYTIDQIIAHPWFQKYNLARVMNKDLGYNEGLRTEDNKLAIDDLTLHRLKEMDIDAEKVIQEINNNVFGSLSATYRIFRRQDTNNFLSSLYAKGRFAKNPLSHTSLPSLFNRPSPFGNNNNLQLSAPNNPTLSNPTFTWNLNSSASPDNSESASNEENMDTKQRSSHANRHRSRRLSYNVGNQEQRNSMLINSRNESLLCSHYEPRVTTINSIPQRTHTMNAASIAYKRKRSNSIMMPRGIVPTF